MDLVDLITSKSAVLFPVTLWAVLLATAIYKLLWKRQDTTEAPLVPGLPLLGNALALGRHGVSYINKCRRKFGDCFTLSLASLKMTFLFEPSHIDYFFSAPDEKITFRPAVEQFTQRVFGLTSRLFFPLHSKMLMELRHLLVPGALAERMQSLGMRAMQLLPCYVHHAQVDLCSLCRGLVFHCAVEAMFGRHFVEQLPELLGLGHGKGEEEEEATVELNKRYVGEGNGEMATATGPEQQEELQGASVEVMGNAHVAPVWVNAWVGQRQAPPRPPVGVEKLARTFFAFEERFEMAASPVPHFFQTDFVRSRSELLRLFRLADGRGLFKGTPAGELLDRTTGLPLHLRPNLLLALLWASQANSIPAAFWSTAFLLLPENALHKASVLEELQLELQTGSLSPDGAEGAAAGAGSNEIGSSSAATSPPGSRRPGALWSQSQLVAAATRLAANRRSAISRCVAEALRLRVQSIDVRQVAAPLDLPSESRPGGRLRLPRGRLLAVCPFESHHDRKLWDAEDPSGAADPWVYDPTRPELRLGASSAVMNSGAGLAFGGGPYRCPGRYFAEQELGLVAQLLLWSYDMTLSYGDAANRFGAPAIPGAPAAAAAASSGGESVKAQASQVGPNEPTGANVPVSSGASADGADPHPQLRAVQGGSLLYAILTRLLEPSAMAWGFGWFDGLDGPIQEWRESGDPAGLLPPCDLRRLVGTKVPKKPCWVQLGRPLWVSNAQWTPV
ncbi:hypothetical protein VaNZ11_007480 [Volvox africanus]|uniref:Cytochrome P450 n=1 Tax=Volvox africanus TaxID=51714 RepID=A0ABQ5S3X0_9CHLO|nr:hypothetical protein VaNZ11_007480 [Volvox africanus]